MTFLFVGENRLSSSVGKCRGPHQYNTRKGATDRNVEHEGQSVYSMLFIAAICGNSVANFRENIVMTD
jgi:hypothetical protein